MDGSGLYMSIMTVMAGLCWLLMLAGAGSLQSQCDNTSRLAGPSTACSIVYRYQWWLVAFSLAAHVGELCTPLSCACCALLRRSLVAPAHLVIETAGVSAAGIIIAVVMACVDRSRIAICTFLGIVTAMLMVVFSFPFAASFTSDGDSASKLIG